VGRHLAARGIDRYGEGDAQRAIREQYHQGTDRGDPHRTTGARPRRNT
jgi:hypothetical protein